MKILHLCLASFYIDNYSYQENMLPKYHVLMGHEVTVIASLQSFDKNGSICFLETESEYVSENNHKVIRLDYLQWMKPINRFLRRYNNLFENIKKENPEIIFIHGCQFWDISIVVKYLKKHTGIKVFVDNHADFTNSARNILSYNILHKIIWKYCAKQIEPFAIKFYGVLPARVEFLKTVYNLPKEKCELLVMGADDEQVILTKNEKTKRKIRMRHGIEEDDFLIITGGKIDSAKKQVLLLMKAVSLLNIKKVKLIVFGSIENDLKEKVLNFVDNKKIKYIGWKETNELYEYLSASDLAVFPGRHSVLWEQAVGTGIPCVFKYWEGTTHVDVGGNCKFIYNDTVDEIKKILVEIITGFDIYKNMKINSEEKGLNIFSYKDIANRAIQIH